MSFPCTVLTYSYTGLAYGCTVLAYSCTVLAFGCTGLAYNCTRPARACIWLHRACMCLHGACKWLHRAYRWVALGSLCNKFQFFHYLVLEFSQRNHIIEIIPTPYPPNIVGTPRRSGTMFEDKCRNRHWDLKHWGEGWMIVWGMFGAK